MKSNNWVAVIPSAILFNNELTDKDKLVYAVISNLTHDKGFCWASNRYIAESLNCTPVTISRSISRLNNLGVIRCSLTKDIKGTQRKIYLALAFSQSGLIKNDKGVEPKSNTNNIINNKVNINNNSKELLSWFNETFQRTFRVINNKKFEQRLKTFDINQIKKAISNAYSDKYHIENNFKYLTPEYFFRNDDNIDKWINYKPNEKTTATAKYKKPTINEYTENISKEFGW